MKDTLHEQHHVNNDANKDRNYCQITEITVEIRLW